MWQYLKAAWATVKILKTIIDYYNSALEKLKIKQIEEAEAESRAKHDQSTETSVILQTQKELPIENQDDEAVKEAMRKKVGTV